MSEFDKIVKNAQSKLKKGKSMSTKSIRYIVESGGGYGESWPTSFIYPPKVGDLVESESGRILIIQNLIHTSFGLSIKVGRNLGGSSGVGGGGGGKLGPLET